MDKETKEYQQTIGILSAMPDSEKKAYFDEQADLDAQVNDKNKLYSYLFSETLEYVRKNAQAIESGNR